MNTQPMNTQPIHSRFDTTLGCIHFNIDFPWLPEEPQTILLEAKENRKSSADAREKYARALRGLVVLGKYSLMVHESAHALQAITHPALFVRCLTEAASMVQAVDALRESPQSLTVPIEGDLSWANALSMQLEAVRISTDGAGKLSFEMASGKAMPNDLSQENLLEDSATIFQYRAEIGAEGTAKSYRRWLGECYRYSRTFDLLSKILGPEETYVALPAIVLAAFDAFSPLRGLIHLLAWASEQPRGMAQELGATGYLVALEEELASSFAPMRPDRPLDPSANLRLERDGVLHFADAMSVHPLAPVVRLAWKDEETTRRLREAVLCPWQAFSRETREALEWFEPFQAPMTLFQVIGDERFSLGDSVLEISPTVVSERDEMQVKGEIVHFFRLKAFASSAATPYARRRPHNCPHLDCRWHRHDMCRGWMEIPTRHEECGFPRWLRGEVHRQFDFDTEMLKPAT